MFTDYRPLTPITMAALFDGRLEPAGIRERIFEGDTTEWCRCLTDGANFLWVFADDQGRVACLTRFNWPNNADRILMAIHEAFGVDIVSEYEPQFWGFDTQEEMDAWESEAACILTDQAAHGASG